MDVPQIKYTASGILVMFSGCTYYQGSNRCSGIKMSFDLLSQFGGDHRATVPTDYFRYRPRL